jgi:hypothetical protein
MLQQGGVVRQGGEVDVHGRRIVDTAAPGEMNLT